jgi:hypothetical protein
MLHFRFLKMPTQKNQPQVLHPNTEHHLISTGRAIFSSSIVPITRAENSLYGPQTSANPFLRINRVKMYPESKFLSSE